MPDLTIPTAEGDLRAYLAVPAVGSGPWPGVVVIHDAFGLGATARGHADHLAAAGYVAVAPDLHPGRVRALCEGDHAVGPERRGPGRGRYRRRPPVARWAVRHHRPGGGSSGSAWAEDPQPEAHDVGRAGVEPELVNAFLVSHLAATVRRVARAAGIYCRISVDGAGEGLGVKRQETDCRALADTKGWTVAEVYVDNDAGAWSGRPRPQYRRMLEDIRRNALDAVIVWHLDRLTRRPVELEQFFETCDAAGVKNLACVTGDVDLSTHDGQFMARILGGGAAGRGRPRGRHSHKEASQARMSGSGR